jgi:hypothetical protein
MKCQCFDREDLRDDLLMKGERMEWKRRGVWAGDGDFGIMR